MALETGSPTAEFELFVADRLKTGRYANAAEVYEAAKAALLRDESDDDLNVDYLRRAIEEGEESGVYEGDVFADLRNKYRLKPLS